MMATEATTTTFEQEVLESDGKVIVDFWAEWCGPCHAVAPVLDRIADDHSVKIVKVNIDQEQSLAQRYGVSSIPMMILFENGEPQASAIGAMPKSALERQLGLSDPE
jgi:thioredoxin 1